MQVNAATGSDAPRLLAAVLIYGSDTRGSRKASWLSVHDIEKRDGRAVVLPGRAATREGLRALLAGIDGKAAAVPAILDPHVLAQGDGYLAWWCPPGHRQVWFRTKHALLGNRTGVTPHPGLVFMVHEDAAQPWVVFAVRGAERPTAETPLFQAPYFNVNGAGAICTGNVDLPKGPLATQPQAWSDVFFRSYFTHPNKHQGLVRYRTGSYAFWKMLLDGRCKSFPDERLVPAKATVGSAFAQLMGGR